eukprot:383183_1
MRDVDQSVVVLVLGDIGRSPRMQYHALSLADQAKYHVDFIGYGETKPHNRVQNHQSIAQHHLSPFGWRLPKSLMFLFIFYAVLKLTFQVFQLFWTLMVSVRSPKFILVQNPPSLPTLFVVHCVCFFRRSKLVIDWHNFGYTILGLSLGQRNPIVKLAYWYERWFGKGAYANFCVTDAMKCFLKSEFNVEATVLYDRSPDFFKRLSISERHEFFVRLNISGAFGDLSDWVDNFREGENKRSSLITIEDAGDFAVDPDSPALVVSSTSWTPDEDFSILLKAVEIIEAKASSRNLPKILFVITGKGPQKSFYEAKIRDMDLTHCRVITVWLAAEDYPRLLGSCDIGVSLHTSSSGLDLPMKVVDMFGCQLPVCAIDFACISELVRHNENGYVFQDSAQLAEQIMSLLKEFPEKTDRLDRFRNEIQKFQRVRWTDSWQQHALPVFCKKNQ